MAEPNKYFPLPPDYGELNPAAQKQARLAVLCDHSTPQRLVQAWSLFRNLYLRPRGEAFYRGGFHPSPPFHYQMIHDLCRWSRNAQAAPRGFGKSFVIGSEVPLLLSLTRPFYSITVSMATDRLIEGRFDNLMIEYTENKAILEDFGEMKPKRGEATWNHKFLHLNNGSVIQGFSIMGRKRGARPQLFIMDDPEFDADLSAGASDSQYLITEKYEYILFRQVIPMLTPESGMFWIGTMINRRCLLYRACEGDDPRFKNWMRRVYAAEGRESPNSTQKTILWPGMWSEDFLKARKAEIGSSAFSAEYLNRPITDETRMLEVNPDLNEYNIPDYRGLPPFESEHLITSHTTVNWKERRWVKENEEYELVDKTGSLQKVFGPMYKVALVDTASGLAGKHDYRAVAVCGYDNSNCLWVLDLWLGKVRDHQFYSKIYELAVKWRVRTVGIEACGTQGNLVDSMEEYVHRIKEKAASAASEMGGTWLPRIVPIRYPARESKGGRIAGLEWRFQSGKIKYPAHRAQEWPFSALYEQTENFTKDLALLRHDDAIDCVAMSQFLVHAKGREQRGIPTKRTLIDRIKTDQPPAPGLPMLSGLSANQLTTEEIHTLISEAVKKSQHKAFEQTRPPANIIG